MTNYPLSLSVDYYYSLSIVIGGVINLLLAAMLIIGTRRIEYSDLKVYRRSRYLTAASLIVFGLGFLLHWWFCPRVDHPLAATALSLTYFHIGGMLLAMSHTSLANPKYLTGRVVARDLCLLCAALTCYVLAMVFNNMMIVHIGFALTISHIIFLAITFYRCFRRTYLLLGNLAENSNRDNLTDQGIRWMYISCQLIIVSGILGTIITWVLHHSTIAPIVMMALGEIVFCYIYLALSNFGLIAHQTAEDIKVAEAFALTEEGKNSLREYVKRRIQKHPFARFSFFTGLFRQW